MKSLNSIFHSVLWSFAAALIVIIPNFSQAAEEAESALDKLWSSAVLYNNPDSAFIQKFALTGRVQADAWSFDSDEGNGSDIDWRRVRFGFKGTMFGDWKFKAKTDLNLSGGDVYKKFTDMYISWEPSKAFKLKFGKQSAAFTIDGHTSSNGLHTTERSVIGTNIWFPQEYMPGVTVAGAQDKWNYHAGVYSSGSSNPELGNFDGSYFVLLSAGYKIDEAFNLDTGVVHFDFVYQDKDLKNSYTRPNETVVSMNFKAHKGSWGLHGDVSHSSGYYGQGDLTGIFIMPLYDITDEFQFVVRYARMESSSFYGIRPTRYASKVVSGRGDIYDEFYAGVNWFIYGHKLKFQLGVEWANMKDHSGQGGSYDSVGTTFGFRSSF